ncbi:MAG: hypothetical protein U0800_24715 [Isosphaeraceae bacterium]
MSRSTRIVLSAVLLLGSGLLWFFSQYGWAFPKTVGAAVVALLLMVVINLGEVSGQGRSAESPGRWP